MKTLTCSQMGGPCNAPISGNSFEEISDNGMKHLQQAHPEMAEQMKNMTKEEGDAWAAKVMPMYEAAPEM